MLTALIDFYEGIPLFIKLVADFEQPFGAGLATQSATLAKFLIDNNLFHKRHLFSKYPAIQGFVIFFTVAEPYQITRFLATPNESSCFLNKVHLRCHGHCRLCKFRQTSFYLRLLSRFLPLLKSPSTFDCIRGYRQAIVTFFDRK